MTTTSLINELTKIAKKGASAKRVSSPISSMGFGKVSMPNLL
jgi:hypothetical protein